jgi:hypothetical protein
MTYCKKRLTLLVVLLIPALVYTGWHLQKTESFALWDILDHYGYEKPDQKKALGYLLREAGVLSQDQSFQDRFPQRKDKNKVLQDIINFVQLTQKYFLLRSGTQERWQVKPTEWMQMQKPETLDALKELGVVEAIPPNNANPDVICVLGATLKTMVVRMTYVADLYNTQHITTKQLVLLAGQRKATIGADGTEAELSQIAQKQGLANLDQLTETHLIQSAYQASTLYNKLPTHVIDTSAGNLPRPTTETTTLEFIQWLKQHPDVKSVVFISNQPFVSYQKAVIAEVFKSANFVIPFEVIGSAATEPFNIQKLVESIGSTIWAKTPQVLHEMSFKINEGKSMNELKELYRNNPLIYQNVGKLALSTAKSSESRIEKFIAPAG